MSNKTSLQKAREIARAEMYEEAKRKKELQKKQVDQEIEVRERKNKAEERSSATFGELVKRLRDICSDLAEENDLEIFEKTGDNSQSVTIYIGTFTENLESITYEPRTTTVQGTRYGDFLCYKDPKHGYFLGVIPLGTTLYDQKFYWSHTKSIRGSRLVIEHGSLNNYSVLLDYKDKYKFSNIEPSLINQINSDLVNSLAQNLERNNCFTLETRNSEDKHGKILLEWEHSDIPDTA